MKRGREPAAISASGRTPQIYGLAGFLSALTLAACTTIQNLDLDLEKIVGKNVADVTKPQLFPLHRTVVGDTVIVEYALYGGTACRFLLTIDSGGRILAWSYPDAETAKKCRSVPLVYAMREVDALRSGSETAAATQTRLGGVVVLPT